MGHELGRQLRSGCGVLRKVGEGAPVPCSLSPTWAAPHSSVFFPTPPPHFLHSRHSCHLAQHTPASNSLNCSFHRTDTLRTTFPHQLQALHKYHLPGRPTLPTLLQIVNPRPRTETKCHSPLGVSLATMGSRCQLILVPNTLFLVPREIWRLKINTLALMGTLLILGSGCTSF